MAIDRPALSHRKLFSYLIESIVKYISDQKCNINQIFGICGVEKIQEKLISAEMDGMTGEIILFFFLLNSLNEILCWFLFLLNYVHWECYQYRTARCRRKKQQYLLGPIFAFFWYRKRVTPERYTFIKYHLLVSGPLNVNKNIIWTGLCWCLTRVICYTHCFCWCVC